MVKCRLAIAISVTTVAVGALASLDADAQTALGTGSALDRNLGVGTGGVNPATPTMNFRDRNLLVTGDVIGGRGFRGSVGYTAESDFRGALGSNDLFSFRAGSAISSAPLSQLGTTYERLRFGQDVGIVEYRRAGSGDPASLHAQDPISFSESRDRLRLDRRIISASSALAPQQGIEPRIVGSAYNPQGTLYVFSASNLRGLTIEPASDNPSIIGFSTYDVARVRQDIAEDRTPAMLGAPFQTQFNILRDEVPADQPASGVIDTRQDTQAGAKRIDTNLPREYEEVLKRVAERYAEAENVDLAASPEVLDQLGKEYDTFRLQLTGRRATANQVDTRAEPTATNSTPQPTGIATDRGVDTTPRDPLMPEPPPGRDPITGLPVKPTTNPVPSSIEFAATLRHGQRITTLTGVSKDRFDELMTTAEQKLREGDYLTAEQRFDRALRFSPGHPLATAGMAHAQIGAGLYLSASLTLRNLFSIQPEMIDTTFGEHLLPRPDRIAAAIGGITRRLEISESKDRAPYGFLLAYIGHQTNDAALIDQGLNAMAEAEPGHPLLDVLQTIWQPAPSEQAEEPASPK